jgi:acyl-CoA synthetase (AMP-forming)/AMP-acid ligase II
LGDSGVGVSRGYWKDEARNALSFPKHIVTGVRMHKTGDLGCILPDGNIQILGRTDFQVKIQGNVTSINHELINTGQRIEIGEIESQMLTMNNVKDAKVVSVTVNGIQSLCGFVVASTSKAVNVQDKLEFKLKRAGLRNSINSSALQLDKHATKQKWTKRNTIRSFRSEPVAFAEFSSLLRQISSTTVKTFVFVQKVEQIPSGFYTLEAGSLVRKSPIVLDKSIFPADNQSIYETSAFVILFAVSNGALSESASQLAAGHIGQRLMELSGSIDIGICPLGGFDYYGVRKVLNVGKKSCFFAHGIVGGKLGSAEVKKSDSRPLPDQLKSFLTKKLPKYMVPHYVFQVEKLPVSSNLKIERKDLIKQAEILISATKNQEVPVALKPVQITYSSQGIPNTTLFLTCSGPRSDADIVSAAIKNVLNITNVDIRANFFDLGANSMSLIRIHKKISETYKGIDLMDLFKCPSVLLLCELIQQKGLSAPKIEPVAM